MRGTTVSLDLEDQESHVMAICGYCNHPGYHAQFIPPGAEPSRRCGDCLRCRQELDQRPERRR
jgi:hypothetical protein